MVKKAACQPAFLAGTGRSQTLITSCVQHNLDFVVRSKEASCDASDEVYFEMANDAALIVHGLAATIYYYDPYSLRSVFVHEVDAEPANCVYSLGAADETVYFSTAPQAQRPFPPLTYPSVPFPLRLCPW